jgi:16S rRNA G966 N2-methylase RsmD
LHSLGIEKETTLVRGSAATSIRNYKPNIAFIDPPYEDAKEYAKSLLALCEKGCPFAVAQHASRAVLEDVYGVMKRTRVLKQGDNSLSFYEQPAGVSTAE